MDENADRAQVPGQQPVPERDVEPLWPPDPGDRGAVPPWAAVAEQRGAPSPVTHPVTPPVAAPPIGRPPVPGQPGVAAQSPPSPSDYPSLNGAVPAPGGWGASGPSGVGSGWAPAQPSWPPPTDPAAASPPPAPPATGAQPTPPSTGPGGVDLNLPFTLDHPTAAADRPPQRHPPTAPPRPQQATGPSRRPPRPPRARTPPTARTPSTARAPPTARRPPAPRRQIPRPQPSRRPGRHRNLAGPRRRLAGQHHRLAGRRHRLVGRHRRPVGPAPQAGGTAPQAGGTAPQAGGPAPQPGQPAPQPGGPGADGSPDGPARPIAESPWAYPPQRPAGTTAPAQEEAGGTPPIPPPPVVPHAGPGQAHPGQPFIPGQAGPAQIPPPPDVTQFSNPPHGLAAPQQAPGQAGPGTPPPGPFPPSPGWYPPPWQQGSPGGTPGQPYQEADGVTRVPAPAYPDAAAYPDASWTPDTTAAPTAEDFARRRQVRPADPVATMGVRAVVNKMGLLRLSPGRHEQELKRDIEMVRRNFGGLRQVTVVNPKGGAGKTVAILLLAMTFGQKRGGYVLAWDNNETQGTLGHARPAGLPRPHGAGPAA